MQNLPETSGNGSRRESEPFRKLIVHHLFSQGKGRGKEKEEAEWLKGESMEAKATRAQEGLSICLIRPDAVPQQLGSLCLYHTREPDGTERLKTLP